MSPRSRQIVDRALAAAQARVRARTAEVLASPPDVTHGRWAWELSARIAAIAEFEGEETACLRACAAIQQWEENVVDFLEEIGVAVAIGFDDRDPQELRRSAFTQSLDPERFGHGGVAMGAECRPDPDRPGRHSSPHDDASSPHEDGGRP